MNGHYDYDRGLRPTSHPITFEKPQARQALTLVRKLAKRSFDIVFSGLALLFFAPFLTLFAAIIFITDGWPVFFVHQRIGQGGRKFGCVKFRTMARNADERLHRILATDAVARAEWAATQKLNNDPRISWMGEFFRKTSLDELPQFWNALVGDMSVVGPRPIVEAEIKRYGSYYRDYSSVRPGITGLWQVSGRSNTTYDERVALDVRYVRTRTFLLDMQIVLMTIKVMLWKDGAK